MTLQGWYRAGEGEAFDEGVLVRLSDPSEHLHEVLDTVADALEHEHRLDAIDSQEMRRTLALRADGGVDALDHGVAVVHAELRTAAFTSMSALVRTAKPLSLGPSEDEQARFVWVIVTTADVQEGMETPAEFAHLLRLRDFRRAALTATTGRALAEAYEAALEAELAHRRIPPELEATGRPFGGALRDLRRRLPHYLDDWRAGLHPKVLSSTLFMFFACLAPAVAFGGLLATLTGGQIGAVETVLASVVCGVAWALFAGQPLTIVGATGPNVIFTGILYSLCLHYDAPFLETAAWTGLWAGLFMVLLSAADASALIRYFTRFSDEIFAALIALIFIGEAAKDIAAGFTSEHIADDTALLSLLLAVGTFGLATSMSRFRRSPYLRAWVRDFLSDFGPAIALGVMSVIGFSLHTVELERLAVPDHFAPTVDRSWFVNPLDAPTWVIGASIVPALLLTILIWTNQNITARLANSADYRLRKGPAYHWDIAVMGALVALMSLFGLPWVVAAVVRSLNHVKSLTIEEDGELVGVVENRLSNFAIHVLLGVALLLFLPLLGQVPMAVLFGMFLFMGVGTLSGNQFMERLRLWILDPERYPPLHYFRVVPPRVVHGFTAVQLVCLGVLWVVKASVLGLLFPFFLALLVPVRMAMRSVFRSEHLALLDAEEVPADEEFRDFGV
jgi:mannitol/fructose-specific phosphotransferase system IIA component (Ntr-type)